MSMRLGFDFYLVGSLRAAGQCGNKHVSPKKRGGGMSLKLATDAFQDLEFAKSLNGFILLVYIFFKSFLCFLTKV